jgi:alpha-glucosidase
VDAAGHEWWQNAVFYELYPRSFADSNNDGIGDLPGITSKLHYLKKLGVDAIWITPCFPSPQVDFGYDVSDYENIDPMYGTLGDFDKMMTVARKDKIRILMDFVMNHTSDQHPWFLDSRSSRTSARRDWYIWRDGKNAGPPNNWISLFGGPAWTFDPTTAQYYYHFFYPQQPDLNWRNPAVKNAMFDVTRWWYARGVAGFRLDAVDTLFEDPQLHDDPVLPGTDKYGDPREKEEYNRGLPEVHDVLRELRTVADQYGAVLIGETYTDTLQQLKEYYGGGEELQMPMDMMFGLVNRLSAPDFRRQIAAAESAGGWPVYVMSNHDIVRAYDRYGDGQHNDDIAKLLAGMYLTLRGTPILYYGEEIGMQNNDPQRKEDVKDPIGKLGWPQEKGRDGERTPMQWTSGPNGGFTGGTPWLPVPASAATHNVENESQDPHSILRFYRRVLKLRHKNAALRDGNYIALNQNDEHVLAYLRTYQEKAVLVLLNFSGEPQKIVPHLQFHGFPSATAHPLLTSGTHAGALSDITLGPYAVYIAEISKSNE